MKDCLKLLMILFVIIMKNEIVNWNEIIRSIAKNSDMTIPEVGYKAGLASSALALICMKDKPADPKYNEGQDLIKMYLKYCDGDPPIIKRSDKLTCSCCQRFVNRSDIMRIKESVYRCKDCVLKAQNRKGHY